MGNRAIVLAALKTVAAKAELLALKYEGNQLWEGDLHQNLSEIHAALNDAMQAARTDR